uniref:RING-type domain-containing protein n=1 Tax=Scleropages formosus TaxID=113540 RepID=A0A8C9WNK5_SCLFO
MTQDGNLNQDQSCCSMYGSTEGPGDYSNQKQLLYGLEHNRRAQAENTTMEQDQFSCPICQNPLKDPVTTPCGHSYCMDCIKDCWDRADSLGVYSCPQCRQTFTPRPVLGRNTMLAEVLEKVKKAEAQLNTEGRGCCGEAGLAGSYCPAGLGFESCLGCLVTDWRPVLSVSPPSSALCPELPS